MKIIWQIDPEDVAQVKDFLVRGDRGVPSICHDQSDLVAMHPHVSRPPGPSQRQVQSLAAFEAAEQRRSPAT